MLSRYDLHRLKIWQLQLKEAVAAQEHRLEALERLILKTGRVPEEVAPFLASVERAIATVKNTISHLEEAANHLATLIDVDGAQVTADSFPIPAAHQRRPGAKLMPKQRNAS